MSVKLWSNVQVAMQSVLGASKTITGITKANPGVVTSVAHGLANGDYVLMTIQGMWQLDSRVCRIASIATDTFQLEGIDTSAYDTFSSGTAAKITFGTTISSAADINVSGGDFDQVDVTTIHDNVKKTIPGASNPVSISMNLNWDPSDAGQLAMKTASDARAQRAFLFTFSDSAKWVFMGYVGASMSPTGQAQAKVTTPVVITAYGKPNAYST